MKQSGFTSTELMIVLSAIGVVSLLVACSGSSFTSL
jgi:prepilin-type N-terminal cleavage/methylation domain-containing protein